MIDESIWRTYTDVGCTAYAEGNLAMAEKMFQSASEALEGKKVSDIKLGATFRNLAVVCHKQGKLDQAAHWYRKALAKYECSSSSDPALVAWTLDGLAEIYFEKQFYQRARPLFKRALNVFEEVFGSHSHVLGPRLLRLGWIANALGKPELALEYFNRARQLRPAA